MMDPLRSLIIDGDEEVSKAFDEAALQDSFSWRNVSTARKLAEHIIDEKGLLRKEEVTRAIQLLQENLYPINEGLHHDIPRRVHLLKALQTLEAKEEVRRALMRIGKPVGHAVAEALIRETLLLKSTDILSDGHARKAVLAAFFTLLRQNVGACFATAPAILIQQEQPLQFINDLGGLLGTGRLRRVFQGEEFVVPLSASWGIGDLRRSIRVTTLGEKPWRALARSPGLLAAFKAAGLDGEKKLQKILKRLFGSDWEEDPFMLISPEEVIEAVLFDFVGITGDDFKAFLLAPTELRVGEVVLTESRSTRSKTYACERFQKLFALAKAAFKAMTDNALLKAWEFTLASLSESKADFAQWNLHSSLGLDPREAHGIGNCFYEIIQARLETLNEEIKECEGRYDHIFAQVKSVEGRVKRAGEKELEWLRAEYRMRQMEMNRVLAERDEAHEKGRRLSALFEKILHFYRDKFKAYFQEVYDAEMHDVTLGPYDDSPAGFRLLYKHGRTSTALWTLIHSPTEFIQALSSFFVATEVELSHLSETEGLQAELTQLISAAILLIKTPEFLTAAFHRVAVAYGTPLIKEPLKHLDRIERKPWSYISGGTMTTLISVYYGIADKPKEVGRWVENEAELLAFLIDTCKELPLSVQNMYRANSDKSMLAFSPTHAFLCKPGWTLLRQGWETPEYTYSWVRDHWIFPAQRFLEETTLTPRMMEHLIDRLIKNLPRSYRSVFKKGIGSFSYPMSPNGFRRQLVSNLSYEGWTQKEGRMQWLTEELDSLLFHTLPFFSADELKKQLELLFEDIDAALREKIFQQLSHVEDELVHSQLMTAQDLRAIAKALVERALGTNFSPIPWHQKITESMQRKKLSYPAPILFADTNWVKNTFGFIVGPGSGELELWRFDVFGSEGRPMAIWKSYLDGTDRKEWGLHHDPNEYTLQ